MPNQPGWAALGNVLGGGIDREGAYLEGRYRSAQTEQAISTARKAQADAVRQEQINEIAREIQANAPDFNNPTDATLAQLIVGGLGSDFNSAMGGRKTGQEIRLRDQIANPETDYATINRNRAALGESPFDPISAVGTRGAFTDARSPDKAVQPPLGEALFPTDPTNTQSDYQFAVGLGAPAGPETFFRVKRNDTFNAGGVTYQRTADGPTPLVSTEETAGNAGAIAGQKKLGQGMAQRTLDLPAAKARLAANVAKFGRTVKIAETLQADEDLWKAVGLGQPIARIPGSAGARLRAAIANLKSRLRLDTLQELRDNSKTGGAVGNVSNFEQEILADYIAALDTNLAPEDFRETLQNIIDHFTGMSERITNAFYETYPELAQPDPAAANLPTFATEAEAEAAGLAPGTRVIIGGVTGTWQ